MAQYELVRMLASKRKNLCVVGDDDQSIYSWRGADIRNILSFEDTFKNVEVIKLEQNYRSTKVILSAANEVIKNNGKRKDKKLWTDNQEGEKIKHIEATIGFEEVFIADKIKEAVEKGSKYGDHAILYRANAQSRAIEDQFVKQNIPYKLFGGVRFYDRKEIKDILAYLRVLYNIEDEVSALRIVNVPKRGIGDASIDKVLEYGETTQMTFLCALNDLEYINGLGSRAKNLEEFKELMDSLIEYAQDHTIVEILEKILEDTSYIEELSIEGTDEAFSRIENIREFINKAVSFTNSAEEATLEAFLEEVALVANIDNYDDNEDCVVLMTMHSAKGLEFPTVFMPGFEDGIFPSYRSIGIDANESDLEEERRLCYVGITRARERLYLISSKLRLQYGRTVENAVSRFLKEIPREFVEHIKVGDARDDVLARAMSTRGVDKTSESKFTEDSKPESKEESKVVKTSRSFREERSEIKRQIIAPRSITLAFRIGDKVKQKRYGIGTVKDIQNAGADFEVTVQFENKSVKKLMAALANLEKVQE